MATPGGTPTQGTADDVDDTAHDIDPDELRASVLVLAPPPPPESWPGAQGRVSSPPPVAPWPGLPVPRPREPAAPGQSWPGAADTGPIEVVAGADGWPGVATTQPLPQVTASDLSGGMPSGASVGGSPGDGVPVPGATARLFFFSALGWVALLAVLTVWMVVDDRARTAQATALVLIVIGAVASAVVILVRGRSVRSRS